MVNVRFVEGEKFNIQDLVKDYEECVLPVKKIAKKYDISENKLQKLIKKNTDFRRTRANRYFAERSHCHFNKTKGVWRIAKKGVYYGSYKDKEVALKIIEELKKVDWDKEQLYDIQEKHGIYRKPRHYAVEKLKCGEIRCTVYKWIGRKCFYFGIYKSEEEAQLVVEKLKEVDWDKTQLERIKKEVKEELQ